MRRVLKVLEVLSMPAMTGELLKSTCHLLAEGGQVAAFGFPQNCGRSFGAFEKVLKRHGIGYVTAGAYDGAVWFRVARRDAERVARLLADYLD